MRRAYCPYASEFSAAAVTSNLVVIGGLVYVAAVTEGYRLVDCSFCGRPNREVHMVAGGDGLRICSVCVEKCADILDQDTGVDSPSGGWVGRWPHKDL